MNEISTERLSNDIKNLDKAEGNKPAAKSYSTIDDKSLKKTYHTKKPQITKLNTPGTKSVRTMNSTQSKNQSTKDTQGNFDYFNLTLTLI